MIEALTRREAVVMLEALANKHTAIAKARTALDPEDGMALIHARTAEAITAALECMEHDDG